MYKLYGCMNDTIYRMASVKDSKVQLIEAFSSKSYSRENTGNKSYSTNIKINTGDFVNKVTNEQMYLEMADYIKKMKLTSIDTLYPTFKVALEYSFTDIEGNIIDAGVIMNNMNTTEVVYLLDIDNATNALGYRRAKLLEQRIPITRSITQGKYGLMSEVPSTYIFTIHSIKIFGNVTNEESDYYIQNLNSSIIDKTMKPTSGTYQSVLNHNVELLNTEKMNIKFNSEEISFRPNVIFVNMSILMDMFCAVADDGYIWSLIEENGGSITTDQYEYPGYYRPIVNRPPRPHRPCPHRPCPPPPQYPPYPPYPPVGTCPPPPRPPRPPKPPKPIKPSNPESLVPDDMKPDNIIPAPDYNQDHGDYNQGEWCRAYDYDTDKFLVVDDSITDEEFDEFTMAKYSDVLPYVSDILVGEYVKRVDSLYY